MKQNNAFIKGIVADLAYNHVKPDNWVFPTHNIRIYNKRGQGFVVSSKLGNEKLFEIGEGFTVVAAEEHRGIVYLVSSDGTNTEIGCYPYPNQWINGTDGFSDEYRALKNYSLAKPISRIDFRTELFGYTAQSKLKLIIDDAFDESVNLYLCDGVNMDKAVNSGFRIDGTINDFVYTASDFDGKINHVLYSLDPPKIEDVSVPRGGTLRPGQYHIFFAYKTASFDRTEYGTESFPISVAYGDSITDTYGELDKDSDDNINYTNKKIVLNLSNIDEDYKYVSVGIMRFFGNGDGNLFHEEYEVAQDHFIDGDTLEIEITGNEDTVILDAGTLYNLYLKERISGDHCFYNSRIWKANLKANVYDKTIFEELAQLITLSSHEGNEVSRASYNDIVNLSRTELMTYQDPANIYKYLGYFDQEIYPFAAKFLLSDGTITDAYPVKGKDEKYGTTNIKGLFRPYLPNKEINIIGVKARIKEAVDLINSDSRYTKIRGIYILRGERIVNMLYDGMLEKTANGIRLSQNRKTLKEVTGKNNGKQCWYYNQQDLWFASEDENGAYHVPVFKINHVIENQQYPLSETKYIFPHAVYNDNGNERSEFTSAVPDFIEDLLTGKERPKWEYSLAVDVPAAIQDSNDTGTEGDAGVNLTVQEAIDTRLKISDDHFAIFSPDFMTEEDHLTQSGSDYWLEIYRRIDYPDYSQGTYGLTPQGNEHVHLKPSRTRVFEIGSGTSLEPATFNTFIYKEIEALTAGGVSQKNPLEWIAGCPTDYIGLLAWTEGSDYVPAIAKPIGSGVYTLPYNANLDSFVTHAGKIWVCIKVIIQRETIDDFEPGGSPSAGPYWAEVLTMEVYSQERGVYEFPMSVRDGDNWVRPVCASDGPYEIPPESLPPSFIPEYHSVRIYNIEKGVHKGRGKFSSYAEDGKEYNIQGKRGYYTLEGRLIHTCAAPVGAVEGSFALVHYNRSYQTPAYMGVIVNEGRIVYEDGKSYMVRVYKDDPRGADFFNNSLNAYNPKYSRYWSISNMIKIDDTDIEKTLYKGDNFKSMSWFRMSHQVDYDDNTDSGYASNGFRSWYRKVFQDTGVFSEKEYLKSAYLLDAAYGHGIMYGMFTQNRRNVSLRSVLEITNEDGSDVIYTFFPQVADSLDPLSWIFSSSQLQDLVESVNINDGYNKTDAYVEAIGVDTDLPFDSQNKKTRIAFSERRIVDSFRDGYRSMDIKNKEDFETNYGEIVRIEELYGFLITIRNEAIMRHSVGQKKITENLQYDDSLIYLSDEAVPLAYYGLQDWHGFLKTKDAIYIVDTKYEMIARISIERTTTGATTPKVNQLSKTLMIEKELKEIIATLNENRTTPMDMNGISLGYNEDYDEVYFSFINGESSQNLIFSEGLSFFIGTSDDISSTFIKFKKGQLMTLNGNGASSHDVYKNDAENALPTFYGQSKLNTLSFIVNGNTEKENTSALTKIFESIEIHSPHQVLDRIEYETELQTGTYTFSEDSSDFWKDSEWQEGAWYTPIIREIEDSDDEYYEDDSVFRGKWIKISLYFRGNSKFYISDIFTQFKQSFV